MSLQCSRETAEQFQADAELSFADWEVPPAILASEPDESRPDDWRLDIIFEEKPSEETVSSILEALPVRRKPSFTLAALPDKDWVTESQAGLEPITAGPFHVRNDVREAQREGARNFLIPASRAFGTGQHETTHGCLLELARLHASGRRFGNIADIGTGTGLLAFAAHSLWPRARILASDIDPVAIEVSAENADLNSVPLGGGSGEVQLVVAAGGDHPLIQGLAPYDLVIANILAGPLIELAPSLSAQVAGGAWLILAGLLESQTERVLAAYRAQGMMAVHQIGDGEWPTLCLRKRRRFGWRRRARWHATQRGEAPGYGSW